MPVSKSEEVPAWGRVGAVALRVYVHDLYSILKPVKCYGFPYKGRNLLEQRRTPSAQGYLVFTPQAEASYKNYKPD
jgi:hypothetical protein